MDEFSQGAEVQEFAEPVQDQSQGTVAQTEEVATPAVQSREDNAKFAQYRRESEQARAERDQAIAELYGDSHGIKTWVAYQQAKQQAEQAQRAQQMNIDPKFLTEFEGLKSELSQFKTERQQLQHEKTLLEQDKTLSSDPQVGELYTKYKDDVHALAKSANCDYDIALTLLLRNKIPELLNSTKSTAEQDAVKRLINNGQSSPGSLSQGGDPPRTNIKSMPKTDFESLITRVKRGEKIQI